MSSVRRPDAFGRARPPSRNGASAPKESRPCRGTTRKAGPIAAGDPWLAGDRWLDREAVAFEADVELGPRQAERPRCLGLVVARADQGVLHHLPLDVGERPAS